MRFCVGVVIKVKMAELKKICSALARSAGKIKSVKTKVF